MPYHVPSTQPERMRHTTDAIILLKEDSRHYAYRESSNIQSTQIRKQSSDIQLEEIRQYVRNIWPQDKINPQDIIDTFDLCIKGMKVVGWQIDPKDPKKISVMFSKPLASYFYYKTTPIKFFIKERVEVCFKEEGSAKVMTFANEALKGTKYINVYLTKILFNNSKGLPKDQKTVNLELSMFFGTKTVEWKLDKLQSVLSTIVPSS